MNLQHYCYDHSVLVLTILVVGRVCIPDERLEERFYCRSGMRCPSNEGNIGVIQVSDIGKCKVQTAPDQEVASFVWDESSSHCFKMQTPCADEDIVNDAGSHSSYCIRMCHKLNVSNAVVKLGVPDASAPIVQNVSTVTCNAGFYRIGGEKISCQLDGKYSSLLPVCTDKRIVPVNCPKGPVVLKTPGIFTSPNYDGELETGCEATYEIKAPPTATVRLVASMALLDENDRITLLQGKTVLQKITGGIGSQRLIEAFGNPLTLNFETKLRHTSRNVCNIYGSSCTTQLQVVKIKAAFAAYFSFEYDCPDFQTPEFGGIEYGYLNDHVAWQPIRNRIAKFRCEDGYLLHGSDKSFCLANGNWSNVTPTCTSAASTTSSTTADSKPTVTTRTTVQQQLISAELDYDGLVDQTIDAAARKSHSLSTAAPKSGKLPVKARTTPAPRDLLRTTTSKEETLKEVQASLAANEVNNGTSNVASPMLSFMKVNNFDDISTKLEIVFWILCAILAITVLLTLAQLVNCLAPKVDRARRRRKYAKRGGQVALDLTLLEPTSAANLSASDVSND